MWRRTRPPQRLQMLNFALRVFFFRGRYGTAHLSRQTRRPK
jgi:hypothetical protein